MHDGLKTESEFYCVHGFCVILQKTIDIGDKLGIDLIIRRERSRGITFGNDPSVLRGNEFESSVDKIAKAGRTSKRRNLGDTGNALV